jgi:hypothetical protein
MQPAAMLAPLWQQVLHWQQPPVIWHKGSLLSIDCDHPHTWPLVWLGFTSGDLEHTQ